MNIVESVTWKVYDKNLPHMLDMKMLHKTFQNGNPLYDLLPKNRSKCLKPALRTWIQARTQGEMQGMHPPHQT